MPPTIEVKMIQALVGALSPDVVGRWRTMFHYKTDHPLDHIMEDFELYWNTLCHNVKPGDIIDCEAHDSSWEFSVSVRSVDVTAQLVKVEMRMIGETHHGARIYDTSNMEKRRRMVEEQKFKADAQARYEQRYKESLDTEEVQPRVEHRGGARWCIMAYDQIVARQMDSREIAEERLQEDEGLAKMISEFRSMYFARKVSELRRKIASGEVKLDDDLPNPVEVLGNGGGSA